MKHYLLTILLCTTSLIIYAQNNNPCYEETYRYKCSIKNYYGDDFVANYKNEWLYQLKAPKYNIDSCTVFLYKKYDTLQRSFSHSNYQYKLGITRDGNCVLMSFLNNRENLDGTCTILLLDSNLLVKDSFNIKAVDYNFELYVPLRYFDIKGDTIMMQKNYFGGRGRYYFTKNELTVKYYNPTFPNHRIYHYDFGKDSTIYFENYQQKDEAHMINNGFKYIIRENDISVGKFDSIDNLFGKEEPFLINSYTTFIENGVVTQLKNGDIVFYKFCD